LLLVYLFTNDQNVSEDFIEHAIDKAAIHNLGYVSVKGLQYKVISEALNGHDVFAALPTGFGKSLTYKYHIYPKSEIKSLQNPPFCLSAHAYNKLINIPAGRLICHNVTRPIYSRRL